MSSFHKWKMLYFNQIDYKETKEHFSIKKDKNIYPACQIYHGLYYCKENYIGNQNSLWQLDGENITPHP